MTLPQQRATKQSNPGRAIFRSVIALLVVTSGMGFARGVETSVNVRDFGAKADGQTDDSTSINAAITYLAEQGGGNVIFPPGVYLVDAVTKHVSLKTNVRLRLDPAATLQSIPNAAGLYAIVSAINVENSGIYGGTIQGDRTLHTGSTGEWGMGIFLKAVNNFEISDVLISDCWGDGVYITDDGNPKNPSRNVRVDRIISTNNRRQGLSAINWIGGHIKSSIFENMNGAPPEAGIDFEPNPPGLQEVSNILISNNTIRNNRGLGLYFAPYKVENNEVSYNNLHGNSAGIAVSSSRNMFLRNIVSLNREGGIILTDRRGHENYNAANNRFIENIIFQNSENAPNPVADITILGRAAHNEFIQNVIGSNSQKAQTCCYGVLIESANSVGNQFVGNKFVGTWKTDVFRDGGTKTIRSETTR